MSHVERHMEEDGTLWAVVRTPAPDGIFCAYGEQWHGAHGHLLNEDGHPTGVLCSWEEEA